MIRTVLREALMAKDVEELLYERIQAMSPAEFANLVKVTHDDHSPAAADDEVDVTEADGTNYSISEIHITLNPLP